MIFSLAFYICFAFTLFVLGWKDSIVVLRGDVDRKRRLKWRILRNPGLYLKTTRIGNYPYASVYTVLIILVFTLVSALRYRVGPDCESYVTSFFNIKEGQTFHLDQDFEKSYYIICRFLGAIGFGRTGFLAFWALLDIALFLFALKDRRFLIPFALYAMVLGPYYVSWMNGMRQIVASMIFLVASVYLVDQNRRILYLLLIFLAFLFHKSALILLPLLFLPVLKIHKNKYVLCSIVLATFILGQSGILNELLAKGEGLVALLGYEDYSERLDYFSGISNEFSIGPRRLLVLFISFAICWFSDKMSDYFKDGFFEYSFLLFFFFTCFKNNLLVNASSVFWRPFLYFEVFELICIAYLLVYFLHRYGLKSYHFIIGAVFVSMYVIFACLSATHDPEEAVLYKFFFLQ